MDNGTEQLQGGVAVITGAGSGIGAALARHAAELGMKTVLADIDSDRIRAVAAEIQSAGGHALPVYTDVSDPQALDALADTVYESFGQVTLLVNNAGIETLGVTWEIPATSWDKTLAININGVIHGVRAFAPRMIAAGHSAFIANTCSVGALGTMPVQTPYILSKHAVLAFSECLYLEMQLKQAPIHVSAIMPGPVATRIFADSATTADASSHHHRQVMQHMLASQGISATEAARLILPRIAAGEFWISTHPQMTREMAQQRAEHLAGLSVPQLPPELLASLVPEPPAG